MLGQSVMSFVSLIPKSFSVRLDGCIFKLWSREIISTWKAGLGLAFPIILLIFFLLDVKHAYRISSFQNIEQCSYWVLLHVDLRVATKWAIEFSSGSFATSQVVCQNLQVDQFLQIVECLIFNYFFFVIKIHFLLRAARNQHFSTHKFSIFWHGENYDGRKKGDYANKTKT